MAQKVLPDVLRAYEISRSGLGEIDDPPPAILPYSWQGFTNVMKGSINFKHLNYTRDPFFCQMWRYKSGDIKVLVFNIDKSENSVYSFNHEGELQMHHSLHSCHIFFDKKGKGRKKSLAMFPWG